MFNIFTFVQLSRSRVPANLLRSSKNVASRCFNSVILFYGGRLRYQLCVTVLKFCIFDILYLL